MVLGPAGNRRFLGVWAAPAAPKTIPKGGGRNPPPSGIIFGAARTPKFEDFRPAQQPCIKLPTVIHIRPTHMVDVVLFVLSCCAGSGARVGSLGSNSNDFRLDLIRFLMSF